MYETALLLDLYQLTMLQGYLATGMTESAVFELFVRRLPKRRGFLLAAGLEQALDYLTDLRFTAADREFLAATGSFDQRTLDHLADLRFTGDVDALPEGTVCFPEEPLLRVVAPLPEAQLVESRLLNLLHLQTMIASKAARCALAAADGAAAAGHRAPPRLVDFGLRRAHGAEAGVLAARAAWIAGFDATATVEAGRRFGIPLSGTMAHSFVQASDSEAEAFERFAAAIGNQELRQPGNVTLLLDTWDTEAAARTLVALAPRLLARGIAITGVRLDSGDLAAHARAVRAILDAGELGAVKIFASGGLDEDAVAALLAQDAPIDGFGIGTRLDTSDDAPSLDMVYKLEEYAGVARRKRAEGKATWPGRKQVWRRLDAAGQMAGDVLTLEGDAQEGTPLLVPVMSGGRRLAPPEPVAAIRQRAASELARLPAGLRTLGPAAAYPVTVAPALHALAAAVDRRGAG